MELSKRRHTKDELKVIKSVRDDFTSAKMSRGQSCYWDASAGGESKGSGSGGDWMRRWDVQEKADLQWYKRPARDEYSSNVKSPMITGRIDSTMNKLLKVNLGFGVYPVESDDPADKRKARIIQELINRLTEKLKYKFNDWYREALVYGTAFLQVYYLTKTRKVKMIATSSKDLPKKQQKEAKEGVRQYIDKEIIEYDDIDVEPCKIQEIYVDPSARCLRGSSYEAQYIIRRMLPSVEQFKSMYKADPDAKNVSKVKSGSAYVATEDREFFEPPTDVMGDDYVEVLHYYNKADDRYIVLANDVLIKDMPLPYNHKELPFVAISPIKKQHQVYGIGIPDRLLALQGEEENLKNLTYDKLHISTNPVINVKKSIYGEYSKGYQRVLPGSMLPVNNQDDVKVLDYPTTSFDTFRAIDMINRDAVIASQIDPSQMGVLQKYVSATTTMVNKEQMDAFVNSLIESYGAGLGEVGKMFLLLMKQFYTVKKASEIRSGKKEYRRVRLEGIEINPETFEIKQTGRDNYSFLEVKPGYFEIAGDIDVKIMPESMEVLSRGVEMQKSQANIAQLAPFMVDPADSQKMMAHPSPWINGPKTVEWYMDTNTIPKGLLINADEDEDISVKRAEEQGKKMLAGEMIPGLAGETDAHKAVHIKQLHVQNKKVTKLDEQYATMSEGPLAPYYMGSLPIGAEVEKEKELARKLAEHLKADDTPRYFAEESAVSALQPPEVPMPPGLSGAEGGGPPPIPTGGNQMAGMEGSPFGGPEGRTGRVSAAEGGRGL